MKKIHFVGMSILSILLSLRPGYHIDFRGLCWSGKFLNIISWGDVFPISRVLIELYLIIVTSIHPM
jgi:hypothetical protein